MVKRVDAAGPAVFVGAHDKPKSVPVGKGVAEGEDVAEFPRRVDVKQRDRWRRRMEGTEDQMGEHGRVLPAREQDHGIAGLREAIAQDADRLGFEGEEMRG